MVGRAGDAHPLRITPSSMYHGIASLANDGDEVDVIDSDRDAADSSDKVKVNKSGNGGRMRGGEHNKE